VLFFLLSIVISMAAFCGKNEDPYQNQSLTEEERYLVQSYARVLHARDRLFNDPIAAESLFAQLDSTIDTLRISNTIKALNQEPDRWAFVFFEIEKVIRTTSHRGNLEETRGGTGTATDVEDNDKSHQ
jgi:hypothetical protein